MQDQRRISLRPPQLAPPQFNTNLSTNSSTPSPYNPLDQRNNIPFNASYSQPRLSRSHQFMTVLPSPLSADFTRQPQVRQSLLLPSLGGGERPLMPNRSAFLPTIHSPLSTFAPQHNPKFLSPQVSPLALKTINVNPAPHAMTTMGSERGDMSADRYPSMGERNLLKYLEKQTVVMERMTGRVNKQMKTDIVQRERDQMGVRVIESKADASFRHQDNNDQRRPRKTTYEDTSIMYDPNIITNNSSLINNNSSSHKRPSIIITSETPKKEVSALETIGQLYLMGKLPSSPGALQVLENKSLEAPDLRKTQAKSTPISVLKKSDTVESINHSSQNDDSSSGSSGSESDSLSEVEEEEKSPMNRTILLAEEKSSPRRSQARKVVSPKRERRYLRDRREQLDVPSYENERAYNSGRTSRTEANLDQAIERPRPKAKSIIKLPNKDGVRSRSGSVAATKPRKSVRIVEPSEQEQFNKQIRAAKKENARMKIQTYLWALLYPKLLVKHVEKKALTRRENISQAICLNYETHFANAEAFLVSAGEKHLRELVSETKSLELFCFKKPLNDKVLDVRISFIAERIKGLFDKLISRTTFDALGKNLIHFLISMSENTGVLPRDFMFDFEVKRLQFTYYGTLKYTTPYRSKMMIGSFMLLRILIHKIILRPWTVFYDMKKSKANKQNLLTVASILYYLTTGIHKRNLALQHNNQCFLTPETRVKPRNPLQAFDEVVEGDDDIGVKQKEAIKDSEPEAITGLIPKDMLKSLFSDRRRIADELKACIEGWHEKIYEITHEEYCQMTGKQREKLVS